jgi:chemotaxis protein CheZ
LDKPLPFTAPGPHDTDPLGALTDQMATLLGQIGAMETFIKRRFDEISMEINATSQQIDMNEDGMAKRFAEILGVMNAISYSGDGTTPANTGVELEAVITDTARAANAILDEADKMNLLLAPADPHMWGDPVQRARMLEELQTSVQNIMLACSFQDIAGQRIRKTLESINEIEERITGALEGMGIGPETLHAAVDAGTLDSLKSGSTQDDIDALFQR